MLKLVDVRKIYQVSDLTVNALDGVSLCFRKNEFVSILGPSGCGKTTTLNIIGGLDKYTSGDLVINGVSTKEYKDHDWDVYRNHHIGFVFQSYNLIPHQTILGNVELALTISGVSKRERQERAKKALDRVGLSKQYYKRPNQLSGGQCQRVAIARALVNEPDILLADEPTGALDTQTSIQIMELIKDISKEKLVIMVTHNPELAEKYSTRIVKLLDGKLQDDSNPCTPEEEAKERENIDESESEEVKVKEKDRAKMSFLTAFKLSSRNLYTKFKRTFMVALAGCIGIVGVSTVLAVSAGVKNYIADMENDMLSGNPVYISSSALDYTSIMGGGLTTNNASDVNPENDKTQVFINSLVKTLYNMNGVTSQNKIDQKYLDFLEDMPEEAVELIQYKYGYQIAPNIYTDFVAGDGKSHKMSVAAIQATYASVLDSMPEFHDYASMISSVTVMTEMPSSAKYIENQYDVVYIEKGLTLDDVLNDKSSLVGVVSKTRNTLNDLELAEYGYFSQEKFLNYCYKVGNSEEYKKDEILQIPETLTYEQIAKKQFTWYPNDTVYTQGTSDDDLGQKYYASAYADGSLQSETDSSYSDYKRAAFSESTAGKVDLNVKCVLKLKSDLQYGCLSSGGLYYTSALSEHMRDYNFGNKAKGISQSQVVTSALDSGSLYNVEMGYKFKFDDTTASKCEKYYLSNSSAIMDYISQFINLNGSSGETKKITSYSAGALGGNEFPTSVYFYCNNFEQKDKLTAYLDKWNDSVGNSLYKIDTTGFYTGKTENEDGTSTLHYYYRDTDSNKYYEVKIKDGYALDKRGNMYKYEVDDNGNQSFYLREDDKIGEAFGLEDAIKINDFVSINVYSLLRYTILGSEMSQNNKYFDEMELAPNRGSNIYRYKDSEDIYQYVMKVKNQSYYKVKLDANGDLIAERNGYKNYIYNKKEDTFYSVEYTLDETDPDNPVYNQKLKKVERSAMKILFSSNDVYSYANVTEYPEVTVAGTNYVLDTKGFYIDTTSLQDIGFTAIKSTKKITKKELYEIKCQEIPADMEQEELDEEVNLVTLSDYSILSAYYYDVEDNGEKYFFIDAEEDNKGRLVVKAKDVSAFSSMASVDVSLLEDYVSTTYYVDSEGRLQSVNPKFGDDPLTISSLLNLNVLGDELTDLSVLEVDDSLQVKYTDMIGIIIDMVNTLINVITYSLVAFTALSLLVSTVMIGIITYVSVVERTKEIGIIRSLGGRKKDVSHLFNAETFIIGLAAGILGIVLTYLLSIVINIVVGSFTGIYTIAALPWWQAAIMILLSVVLTLISGLIPAKSAAGKDPVVALRTE